MKALYLNLLEQNWTLNDIDEMDFYYYLDLLIFKANKKGTEETVYADDVL